MSRCSSLPERWRAGADPFACIKSNPGRIKSVHPRRGKGYGRGYNVAFG